VRPPSELNRVAVTQERTPKRTDAPFKIHVDAVPVNDEVDKLRLEAGPRAHEHQAE
jgi:hypothetical protein